MTEITNYFEPVLSRPMQDYAHMAFNNLFLTFERLENDNILVKRKKRGQNEEDLYLGTCFYTEHDTIGELEIEIDKEKIRAIIKLSGKKFKQKEIMHLLVDLNFHIFLRI